jgi:hypothetical protein
MFEKRSQPGAPLRNRTVDLLLTMYCCAVLQPQVEQLTCENTSTHWHSQAPDKPRRAPFATQSATHFDLSGVQADRTRPACPDGRRRRCLPPGRTGALSHLRCPATATSAAGRPYPPLPHRGVALEDDLWLLAGGWHGDSLSRCHAHRTPKRSYAHVRLGEPLPQAGCLVDGRPRDVGEIGGALERDEPVAAVGIPAGTCGLVSWAARGPDACCEGL